MVSPSPVSAGPSSSSSLSPLHAGERDGGYASSSYSFSSSTSFLDRENEGEQGFLDREDTSHAYPSTSSSLPSPPPHRHPPFNLQPISSSFSPSTSLPPPLPSSSFSQMNSLSLSTPSFSALSSSYRLPSFSSSYQKASSNNFSSSTSISPPPPKTAAQRIPLSPCSDRPPLSLPAPDPHLGDAMSESTPRIFIAPPGVSIASSREGGNKYFAPSSSYTSYHCQLPPYPSSLSIAPPKGAFISPSPYPPSGSSVSPVSSPNSLHHHDRAGPLKSLSPPSHYHPSFHPSSHFSGASPSSFPISYPPSSSFHQPLQMSPSPAGFLSSIRSPSMYPSPISNFPASPPPPPPPASTSSALSYRPSDHRSFSSYSPSPAPSPSLPLYEGNGPGYLLSSFNTPSTAGPVIQPRAPPPAFPPFTASKNEKITQLSPASRRSNQRNPDNDDDPGPLRGETSSSSFSSGVDASPLIPTTRSKTGGACEDRPSLTSSSSIGNSFFPLRRSTLSQLQAKKSSYSSLSKPTRSRPPPCASPSLSSEGGLASSISPPSGGSSSCSPPSPPIRRCPSSPLGLALLPCKPQKGIGIGGGGEEEEKKKKDSTLLNSPRYMVSSSFSSGHNPSHGSSSLPTPTTLTYTRNRGSPASSSLHRSNSRRKGEEERDWRKQEATDRVRTGRRCDSSTGSRGRRRRGRRRRVASSSPPIRASGGFSSPQHSLSCVNGRCCSSNHEDREEKSGGLLREGIFRLRRCVSDDENGQRAEEERRRTSCLVTRRWIDEGGKKREGEELCCCLLPAPHFFYYHRPSYSSSSSFQGCLHRHYLDGDYCSCSSFSSSPPPPPCPFPSSPLLIQRGSRSSPQSNSRRRKPESLQKEDDKEGYDGSYNSSPSRGGLDADRSQENNVDGQEDFPSRSRSSSPFLKIQRQPTTTRLGANKDEEDFQASSACRRTPSQGRDGSFSCLAIQHPTSSFDRSLSRRKPPRFYKVSTTSPSSFSSSVSPPSSPLTFTLSRSCRTPRRSHLCRSLSLSSTSSLSSSSSVGFLPRSSSTSSFVITRKAPRVWSSNGARKKDRRKMSKRKRDHLFPSSSVSSSSSAIAFKDAMKKTMNSSRKEGDITQSGKDLVNFLETVMTDGKPSRNTPYLLQSHQTSPSLSYAPHPPPSSSSLFSYYYEKVKELQRYLNLSFEEIERLRHQVASRNHLRKAKKGTSQILKTTVERLTIDRETVIEAKSLKAENLFLENFLTRGDRILQSKELHRCYTSIETLEGQNMSLKRKFLDERQRSLQLVRQKYILENIIQKILGYLQGNRQYSSLLSQIQLLLFDREAPGQEEDEETEHDNERRDRRDDLVLPSEGNEKEEEQDREDLFRRRSIMNEEQKDRMKDEGGGGGGTEAEGGGRSTMVLSSFLSSSDKGSQKKDMKARYFSSSSPYLPLREDYESSFQIDRKETRERRIQDPQHLLLSTMKRAGHMTEASLQNAFAARPVESLWMKKYLGVKNGEDEEERKRKMLDMKKKNGKIFGRHQEEGRRDQVDRGTVYIQHKVHALLCYTDELKKQLEEKTSHISQLEFELQKQHGLDHLVKSKISSSFSPSSSPSSSSASPLSLSHPIPSSLPDGRRERISRGEGNGRDLLPQPLKKDRERELAAVKAAEEEKEKDREREEEKRRDLLERQRLEERCKDLERRVKASEERSFSETSEVKRAHQQISELQGKLVDLQQVLITERAQFKVKEEGWKSQMSEVKQMAETMHAKNDSYSRGRESELQKKVEEYHEEFKRQETEKVEILERMLEAEKGKEPLRQALEAEKLEKSAALKESENLQKDLLSSQSKVKELELLVESLKKDLAKEKEEKDKMKSEYEGTIKQYQEKEENLQKQVQTLTQENETLRSSSSSPPSSLATKTKAPASSLLGKTGGKVSSPAPPTSSSGSSKQEEGKEKSTAVEEEEEQDLSPSSPLISQKSSSFPAVSTKGGSVKSKPGLPPPGKTAKAVAAAFKGASVPQLAQEILKLQHTLALVMEENSQLKKKISLAPSQHVSEEKESPSDSGGLEPAGGGEEEEEEQKTKKAPPSLLPGGLKTGKKMSPSASSSTGAPLPKKKLGVGPGVSTAPSSSPSGVSSGKSPLAEGKVGGAKAVMVDKTNENMRALEEELHKLRHENEDLKTKVQSLETQLQASSSSSSPISKEEISSLSSSTKAAVEDQGREAKSAGEGAKKSIPSKISSLKAPLLGKGAVGKKAGPMAKMGVPEKEEQEGGKEEEEVSVSSQVPKKGVLGGKAAKAAVGGGIGLGKKALGVGVKGGEQGGGGEESIQAEKEEELVRLRGQVEKMREELLQLQKQNLDLVKREEGRMSSASPKKKSSPSPPPPSPPSSSAVVPPEDGEGEKEGESQAATMPKVGLSKAKTSSPPLKKKALGKIPSAPASCVKEEEGPKGGEIEDEVSLADLKREVVQLREENGSLKAKLLDFEKTVSSTAMKSLPVAKERAEGEKKEGEDEGVVPQGPAVKGKKGGSLLPPAKKKTLASPSLPIKKAGIPPLPSEEAEGAEQGKRDAEKGEEVKRLKEEIEKLEKEKEVLQNQVKDLEGKLQEKEKDILSLQQKLSTDKPASETKKASAPSLPPMKKKSTQMLPPPPSGTAKQAEPEGMKEEEEEKAVLLEKKLKDLEKENQDLHTQLKDTLSQLDDLKKQISSAPPTSLQEGDKKVQGQEEEEEGKASPTSVPSPSLPPPSKKSPPKKSTTPAGPPPSPAGKKKSAVPPPSSCPLAKTGVTSDRAEVEEMREEEKERMQKLEIRLNEVQSEKERLAKRVEELEEKLKSLEERRGKEGEKEGEILREGGEKEEGGVGIKVPPNKKAPLSVPPKKKSMPPSSSPGVHTPEKASLPSKKAGVPSPGTSPGVDTATEKKEGDLLLRKESQMISEKDLERLREEINELKKERDDLKDKLSKQTNELERQLSMLRKDSVPKVRFQEGLEGGGKKKSILSPPPSKKSTSPPPSAKIAKKEAVSSSSSTFPGGEVEGERDGGKGEKGFAKNEAAKDLAKKIEELEKRVKDLSQENSDLQRKLTDALSSSSTIKPEGEGDASTTMAAPPPSKSGPDGMKKAPPLPSSKGGLPTPGKAKSLPPSPLKSSKVSRPLPSPSIGEGEQQRGGVCTPEVMEKLEAENRDLRNEISSLKQEIESQRQSGVSTANELEKIKLEKTDLLKQIETLQRETSSSSLSPKAPAPPPPPSSSKAKPPPKKAQLPPAPSSSSSDLASSASSPGTSEKKKSDENPPVSVEEYEKLKGENDDLRKKVVVLEEEKKQLLAQVKDLQSQQGAKLPPPTEEKKKEGKQEEEEEKKDGDEEGKKVPPPPPGKGPVGAPPLGKKKSPPPPKKSSVPPPSSSGVTTPGEGQGEGGEKDLEKQKEALEKMSSLQKENSELKDRIKDLEKQVDDMKKEVQKTQSDQKGGGGGGGEDGEKKREEGEDLPKKPKPPLPPGSGAKSKPPMKSKISTPGLPPPKKAGDQGEGGKAPGVVEGGGENKEIKEKEREDLIKTLQEDVSKLRKENEDLRKEVSQLKEATPQKGPGEGAQGEKDGEEKGEVEKKKEEEGEKPMKDGGSESAEMEKLKQENEDLKKQIDLLKKEVAEKSSEKKPGDEVPPTKPAEGDSSPSTALKDLEDLRHEVDELKKVENKLEEEIKKLQEENEDLKKKNSDLEGRLSSSSELSKDDSSASSSSSSATPLKKFPSASPSPPPPKKKPPPAKKAPSPAQGKEEEKKKEEGEEEKKKEEGEAKKDDEKISTEKEGGEKEEKERVIKKLQEENQFLKKELESLKSKGEEVDKNKVAPEASSSSPSLPENVATAGGVASEEKAKRIEELEAEVKKLKDLLEKKPPSPPESEDKSAGPSQSKELEDAKEEGERLKKEIAKLTEEKEALQKAVEEYKQKASSSSAPSTSDGAAAGVPKKKPSLLPPPKKAMAKEGGEGGEKKKKEEEEGGEGEEEKKKEGEEDKKKEEGEKKEGEGEGGEEKKKDEGGEGVEIKDLKSRIEVLERENNDLKKSLEEERRTRERPPGEEKKDQEAKQEAGDNTKEGEEKKKEGEAVETVGEGGLNEVKEKLASLEKENVDLKKRLDEALSRLASVPAKGEGGEIKKEEKSEDGAKGGGGAQAGEAKAGVVPLAKGDSKLLASLGSDKGFFDLEKGNTVDLAKAAATGVVPLPKYEAAKSKYEKLLDAYRRQKVQLTSLQEEKADYLKEKTDLLDKIQEIEGTLSRTKDELEVYQEFEKKQAAAPAADGGGGFFSFFGGADQGSSTGESDGKLEVQVELLKVKVRNLEQEKRSLESQVSNLKTKLKDVVHTGGGGSGAAGKGGVDSMATIPTMEDLR
ncbi:hypothetical protein CSUI_007238, partial [Cystoisospora suis]